MKYRFTIQGKLPGMNEYIKAINGNRYKGNTMKQNAQELIFFHIPRELRNMQIEGRVWLKYEFYEPDKRRDLDNVAGFAHKVIQDTLVKSGILKNDGWENISGFSDEFYLDRDNPRIAVTIIEDLQ